MPKEQFWHGNANAGDTPDLTVQWGDLDCEVHINGLSTDRSGINRLIHALRRARNQTYGTDE